MKLSTFKKKLEVKGTVKSVTGEIIVTMNYETVTFERYNPFSHESTPASRSVHKVECEVDGMVLDVALELPNEEKVLEAVEKMTAKTEAEMMEISNSKPIKTFKDK